MRLLLAEDEPSLSRALSHMLKKSNYEVDTVFDGEEAIEYIHSINYDCILLDVMMPKMTGIDVLQSIRKEGVTIPVIMLTAKSEVDDKVLGLDSGADDYVTKPFEIKELLARIRSVTRPRISTEANTISFANSTLNRSTFVLSTQNGTVKLANKEYQLLEMFMSNPGQILPVDRIYEKIWGNDNNTEINVVWVYISNIRKKLSKINADFTIKATRNIGYYLEENS